MVGFFHGGRLGSTHELLQAQGAFGPAIRRRGLPEELAPLPYHPSPMHSRSRATTNEELLEGMLDRYLDHPDAVASTVDEQHDERRR